MHNKTGTGTHSNDYRSDACTYYGSYRCDHSSTDRPGTTGTWTLKGIMVGAGTSSVIPSAQITLTFKNDVTRVVLGDATIIMQTTSLPVGLTSFGKTISIGPIISTQKFCADTSDQELTYLANLQKAETYSITTNNMMIRTSTFSQFSYVNGLG